MYIILKDTDDSDRPEVVVVFAKSSQHAKQLAQVDESHSKWQYFPSDLICNMKDVSYALCSKRI